MGPNLTVFLFGFVLGVIGLGSAYGTDLDLALAFIECTQKALASGLPEADIPSHEPLIISHNFSFDIPLGAGNVTVELKNLKVDGITWWNVTQADQVESDDDTIDVFNYTIYWKIMTVSGDYEYKTESEDNSGTISIELDHVNWSGIWNFTKPGSGKDETLNEFSLKMTVTEAQVNISNLGLIGDLVNGIGGQVVSFLINNNPAGDEAAELLRQKIIKDWMLKPERIDAIISNCQK
ncbi:hypothetical protein NQ317_019307 [Molorchus minor]|uniref:Juvenile hormone binding protein n=1 Tax=Molorchus minor TaxID=1323400 RepID=A0ABQ9JDU3_9CUCU|nr:hypothetical protein NQ317_019307 [Molorchus minor]